MWPGAKGHLLMSKSFFTPFVGGEVAKEMRSLGGTEERGGERGGRVKGWAVAGEREEVKGPSGWETTGR